MLVGRKSEGGGQVIESAADGEGVAAPVLELDRVDRVYGDTVALDGVTVRVTPGERVGLLGPNGAGKSTFVLLAPGLLRPTRGHVALGGMDPRSTSAHQMLGVVLQDAALPDHITVREMLSTYGRFYRRPRVVEELLEETDLTALAGRRTNHLSGGEAQRALTALAMAGDPDLLILDEPTAGMDVPARRRLLETLRHAPASRALLLTSHNLADIERVCERVLVLRMGQVIADSPIGELKARSGRTLVSFRATEDTEAVLADPPGDTTVEGDEERIRLLTSDPNGVLAELAQRGVPVEDLEVRQPSLEDAFIEMTATGPARCDAPASQSAGGAGTGRPSRSCWPGQWRLPRGFGGLARLEALRTLRNRRYVGLTVAVPIAFLFAFRSVLPSGGDVAGFALGMACFAAIGAALGTLGYRLAWERESGWGATVRALPVGAGSYLVSKGLSGIVTAALAIAAVMIAAGVSGSFGGSGPGRLVAAAAVITLGTLPFLALSFALGMWLDNESCYMLSFVLLFGLSYLGGFFQPLDLMPTGLQNAAHWLPGAPFLDLANTALLNPGAGAHVGRDVAILCAYLVVLGTLGLAGHRREVHR